MKGGEKLVLSQLSESGKREVKKAKCMICDNEIKPHQSFELNKIRQGRYILYCFTHTECCLYKYFKIHSYGEMKGDYNGEEVKS